MSARARPTPRLEMPSRERSLRRLVAAAADLASYCEHVEHNERHDVDDIIGAASQLRRLAGDLARADGSSLHLVYRDRLAQVEATSLLRDATGSRTPGADAAAAATTWEELQIAQILHDRQFHPDVFGLSKVDQVRHYTFHVTKLAGLMATAIDADRWGDFAPARTADVAIFGVKLATVSNVRLSSAPIDD